MKNRLAYINIHQSNDNILYINLYFASSFCSLVKMYHYVLGTAKLNMTISIFVSQWIEAVPLRLLIA